MIPSSDLVPRESRLQQFSKLLGRQTRLLEDFTQDTNVQFPCMNGDQGSATSDGMAEMGVAAGLPNDLEPASLKGGEYLFGLEAGQPAHKVTGTANSTPAVAARVCCGSSGMGSPS